MYGSGESLVNGRMFQFAIILPALLMLGCVATKQQYSDPLAEIGNQYRGAGAADFSAVNLGIVFSGNTRQSMGYVKETQDLIEAFPLANTAAMSDLDAGFLTKRIDALLRDRFKTVVTIDNPKMRRQAGVDAVMVLDIQVQMGLVSGTETLVKLKGIFLDHDTSPIGTVEGNGAATIPYPAWTYVFEPAAADAVVKFTAALDRAGDISKAVNRTVSPLVEVALAAPSPQSATPVIVDGKRIALVIGNSDYRIGALPNPVRDAALMANTLERVGFDVEALYNSSQRDLRKGIIAFGDRLEAGGADAVGLFYYAGHGVQVKGRNYLIPVEADINREKDVIVEAVDIDTVLEAIDLAGNNLNFVILDACRNNPYARSFRSASRGLARMQSPIHNA